MRRGFWLVGWAVLALASAAAAEDTTYTYDSLGRLASATFVDGGTTYIIVYSYDLAGNRTQVVNQASANSAPTAVGDSISATAGSATTFDPRSNDSDPNGDAITISAKTDGAHGAVVINSGTSVSYTAVSGYTGSDTFTYTISDGKGGFANGAVSVTVTSTNQAPTAVNDSQTAQKNTNLTFDPRGNDTDANGDPLTITAKSTPAHGSLSIVSSGSQLSYTPTTNYVGTDSFTYTISDGRGGTSTATVSMFVNGAPVATNDSKVAQKDIALTFDPRTNDTDPNSDTLTIISRSTPAHGVLNIGGGGTSLIYDPTAGYTGPDSFTYTVSDGKGATSTATVTMSVNAPPVTTADTKTTTTNTAVTFDPRTNDSDPDSDTLSVTGKTNGSSGTVSFTSTSLTYTPNTGFTGTDTFSYTVTDSRGGSSNGGVTVTVSASSNHNPVANDDSTDANAYYAGGAWVFPSVSFNPKTNDTDADSDTLTITGVTQGMSGTVTFTGSTVSYTYQTHYHPTGMDDVLVDTDSFTYTISDGHGGTATATVYINVVVY